jgi:hypothetical protein
LSGTASAESSVATAAPRPGPSPRPGGLGPLLGFPADFPAGSSADLRVAVSRQDMPVASHLLVGGHSTRFRGVAYFLLRR